MNSKKTIKAPPRAITRTELVYGSLLSVGILIGTVVLAFAFFLYIHSIPKADIGLTNVAQDTSFYVGTARNSGQGCIQIAMLVTGNLDDTTASISVDYAKQAVLMKEIYLTKGRVSQLYQSDFYNSQAKVTYRHGHVKRGNLRVQIVFSYPPEEWLSTYDK